METKLVVNDQAPGTELDEEKVLALAWPNGTPPAERAYLASIPEPTRRIVVARLNAVCRAEAGARDLAALAEGAGVGRASLFKLRRRWRDAGTLASIAPYAGTGRSSSAARLSDDELRLRSELSDLPGRKAFAKLKSTSLLSEDTLRRAIRDEDRNAAMTESALMRDFGRRFAFDWSAVGIPVIGTGRSRWAAAQFLLERSAGLICSWWLRGDGTDEGLLYECAFRGARFAVDHRLRVLHRPDSSSPEIDVVVGRIIAGAEGLRLGQRLEEMSAAAIHDRAPRRYGRYLIESVGASIGSVRLMPRVDPEVAIVPESIREKRLPVPVADARLLLGQAVERHNSPIMKRLRELRLLEGNGDPSALIEAIKPLNEPVQRQS